MSLNGRRVAALPVQLEDGATLLAAADGGCSKDAAMMIAVHGEDGTPYSHSDGHRPSQVGTRRPASSLLNGIRTTINRSF